MAMSKRIERVSDGWVFEGPDWLHEPPPHGQLKWSDVSRNAGYADYAALITAEKLRAWNERDKEFASKCVHNMTAKAQELERILTEAPPKSKFRIVCYEWESGYGD